MSSPVTTTGSGLLAGLSCARRGIATAWASPRVRTTYLQLVAVLFAIATALDVLGIWTVVAWTRPDPDAAVWMTIALVLLRIAGIAMVLLVAPVLAMFVVNLLFPFLGERVFLAGLRQLAPARADHLAAQPGLPVMRSLIDALLRMALFLATSCALLVLSFIPVLGSIAGPVLQAWRTALACGWELLDPYFDKLGYSRAQQRATLRAHQPELLGFAFPFVFVMAIPVVGPLVFGLAQAGIATLVVEVIEREPPA
ncbi:MAG: EI24 domain-containing protein [Deltaproteobacteria bacterium]|nr:EI24 domain-containing protein [Nannocystaceae bacterium]